MDLDQGLNTLKECESRLRSLVAEAAATGEYEIVLQLADWARSVARLQSVGPPIPIGSHESAASKHPETSDNRASGQHPRRPATEQRRKSNTHRSRNAKESNYPRFARHKEELVKIGWSKKERQEYQHKAPRSVVDSLLKRVIQVSASGDIFTTDALFPLRLSDGSSVPSYQAYLALAWLKAIGLLQQHGRQGYSLTMKSEKISVDPVWGSLPKI